MAQKINENDIQFNNSIPVPGNSGAPSTPGAGQAKVYGIGTSNLRPGFINEGGTAEVIMTNAGTTGTTLGYAQITSNFSTATTGTQVTGLSATVTVPSGGRRVKITVGAFSVSNSTAGAGAVLKLWDGAVTSGTQIGQANTYNGVANSDTPLSFITVVTPSAGSKTYNVGLGCGGGTATMSAAAVAPAFILVELI